jgi:hypothetical protein
MPSTITAVATTHANKPTTEKTIRCRPVKKSNFFNNYLTFIQFCNSLDDYVAFAN